MAGTTLTIYLAGAFGGVCVLVLVLSLLIGHAYDERMLWWHAAALAAGLLSHAFVQDRPLLSLTLWLVQLALAAQALRVLGGATGALRRPALALRALSLALAVVAVWPGPDAELVPWMLLPWAAITGWYVFRAWHQNRPWVYWLALGQLALAAQWLVWVIASGTVTGTIIADHAVSAETLSAAALAVFAIATYIAMVWMSRLRSENELRVEARERTDPLTGLATPRVFFDRADGALIRSRNMGYACALVLIRVDNIEQVVQERGLENNESVILAASRAIGSTLRAQDSAARLSSNRFAVLAEGIAEGGAAQLATRILAHGLRAGEWGLRGSELHLQMAVVEISQTELPVRGLLRQLEDALHTMSHQPGAQHIRTLPRVVRQAA